MLEAEPGLELDHPASQARQGSPEVAGIGEIRVALAPGLEWRQVEHIEYVEEVGAEVKVRSLSQPGQMGLLP